MIIIIVNFLWWYGVESKIRYILGVGNLFLFYVWDLMVKF